MSNTTVANSNVIVFTSSEGTMTMPFDKLPTVVNLAGEFLDAVDGWSKSIEIIIVHRNSSVLRHTCRTGGDLIEYIKGYVSCLWLLNPNHNAPMLHWADWADKDAISVIFRGVEQPD